MGEPGNGLQEVQPGQGRQDTGRGGHETAAPRNPRSGAHGARLAAISGHGSGRVGGVFVCRLRRRQEIRSTRSIAGDALGLYPRERGSNPRECSNKCGRGRKGSGTGLWLQSCGFESRRSPGGVGVLGVLTVFAMRRPDRFDAGTLHQVLKRDLSSYGRASALQAGEIGSTPIGSTKLVSGLVADGVLAAVS